MHTAKALLLTASLLAVGALPALPADGWTITTPGKPGSAGLVPQLGGLGPLTPGSVGQAVLEDGLADSTATLVIGLSELAAPFKGGVLGPFPHVLLGGLPLDATGALMVPFSLPAVAEVGWTLWLQSWSLDPGALANLSASNTLRMTVQEPQPGPRFAAPVLPTGLALWRLVSGDIDADGWPDLMAHPLFQDQVHVIPGLGGGRLGQPVSYSIGPGHRDGLLADLDGDGHSDFVAALAYDDAVGRRLGSTDGSLGPQVSFPVGDYPSQVAVADLDADGAPEVLAANTNSDDLSVLPGLGNGSFGQSSAYPTGVPPGSHATHHGASELLTGDYDGDQSCDALVMYGTANTLHTMLGVGDGSLTQGPVLTLPGGQHTNEYQFMASGDLDLDGDLDVVTGNDNVSQLLQLRVLLGQGDGSFVDAVAIGVSLPVWTIDLADMDSDGVLDLLISRTVSGTGVPGLGLLTGVGDGSFGPETMFSATAAGSVAAVDLDADGRLDIAATGSGLFVQALFADDEGGFELPESSPTQGWANSLSALDVDGDGLIDLLESSMTGPPASVRFGLGQGDFTPPIFISIHFGSAEPAQGDMNGDSLLDLVFPAPDNPYVATILALGGREFAAPTLTLQLGNSTSLDLGDLDGDADLDVVGGHFGLPDGPASGFGVLLGAGDGTLGAPTFVPSGFYTPVDIELGDLDANGTLDVVAATDTFGGGQAIVRRLGNGHGGFGPLLGMSAAPLPHHVALADLDADGDLDIVGAQPDTLSIHLGDGVGGFAPTVLLTPGRKPGDVEIADIDGDGILDLGVALDGVDPESSGQQPGSLCVLRGLGDGSFASPEAYLSNTGARHIALSDLDGDGLIDAAITSETLQLLTWHFQKP